MGQKYISSKNNAQIAQICKLKQKKHRDQTGLFYVEGAKLLKEALNSRYRENIRYIIATENMQSAVLEITDVEMIFVADELYKKLSDESAPEGVMCVLQKPPEEGFVSYKRPVVALCSLRDPGNVGAIVRSADALGGFDLVLSGDCADIYSQKTQRAAMGAIFRQNIKISENIKKDIENLKKNGYNIFAA
ncbi:MAG: RNA methyltransferase, partial [Oscillospiraceae bacterium]|nr:RNA methyltransferase [Oscillospiraceae bacterium]